MATLPGHAASETFPSQPEDDLDARKKMKMDISNSPRLSSPPIVDYAIRVPNVSSGTVVACQAWKSSPSPHKLHAVGEPMMSWSISSFIFFEIHTSFPTQRTTLTTPLTSRSNSSRFKVGLMRPENLTTQHKRLPPSQTPPPHGWALLELTEAAARIQRRRERQRDTITQARTSAARRCRLSTIEGHRHRWGELSCLGLLFHHVNQGRRR